MRQPDIRAYRDATPFVPFSVRMVDQREYRVPHRDFFIISPSGHYALIHHPDDSQTSINLLFVTEIKADVPFVVKQQSATPEF